MKLHNYLQELSNSDAEHNCFNSQNIQLSHRIVFSNKPSLYLAPPILSLTKFYRSMVTETTHIGKVCRLVTRDERPCNP